MAWEVKPNTGTISKSKKTNPKQRDANGSATVCCPGCGVVTDYWISGWIREGRRGRFTSLKFEQKDEQKKDVKPKTTNPEVPEESEGKSALPKKTERKSPFN